MDVCFIGLLWLIWGAMGFGSPIQRTKSRRKGSDEIDRAARREHAWYP
jgi:hypothetical protein